MIHILARRVALLGIESCNPYMVSHKAGPSTGKAVMPDKRRDSVVGLELVGGGLPDVVLHAGIDDLPVAHRLRIGSPACLEFRLQHGRLVIIGVAIAVLLSLA